MCNALEEKEDSGESTEKTGLFSCCLWTILLLAIITFPTSIRLWGKLRVYHCFLGSVHKGFIEANLNVNYQLMCYSF